MGKIGFQKKEGKMLTAAKWRYGKSVTRILFSVIRPRQVRTMRQFAEEEIILPPGGPRAGLRFSCDFMPWTGLVLDEFDAGKYHYFWISGPIQDGKTTLALIIPMMYFLFEIGENIIFGAPKMEIGQGKFEEEVKPMILRSAYADLLPERGRGVRGGRAESILFSNGARLRFMAAGGGDEQRSSFPARVVFITEADKMDEPGVVSREADPVTQIIARTAAFAKVDLAYVFAECTMSKISGRTNQEITIRGTNTRVAVPCPHCGEYVIPEREHFQGWQGAKNVIEAREKGCYACQSCAQAWTEEERITALNKPVLVAEGQTVDKEGRVQGALPQTRTFGFRWNAMHSALKSQAFIAEKEFEANRSANPNAQKELQQFTWALPYEEEPEDLSGLDVDMVQGKISRHPKGIVPKDAKFLTVAVDTGLSFLNWTAWAWTQDAQGYLIDYGEIPVPQADIRARDPMAILLALHSLRSDIFDLGWQKADGSKAMPNIVLVDSGFKKEITYAFTREGGAAYLSSKGLGSKRDQERWHEPRLAKGRVMGHGWFITQQPGGVRLLCVNADEWKREVHEGFRVLLGTPGSLSLFQADKIEHLQFAKQITAERRIEEYVPGKGTQVYWSQGHRANHYLDCSALCRCAADILGVSALPRERPPVIQKKQAPEGQVAVVGERRIRTHY
jgi:phage terminase large subunit GpA-like protein